MDDSSRNGLHGFSLALASRKAEEAGWFSFSSLSLSFHFYSSKEYSCNEVSLIYSLFICVNFTSLSQLVVLVSVLDSCVFLDFE